MAQPANLALDGAEPRLSADEKRDQAVVAQSPAQRQFRLHDPNVTFEEYLFYAQKTRAEEAEQPKVKGRGILSVIFPSKSDRGVRRASHHGEKDGSEANPAVVSELEWTNAHRALRTATRGAIFYLM